MKLTGVELRRIEMPLVAPFRTSFGTETVRDVLLVRVFGSDGEGWGECVAFGEPFYSYEYVDGAHDVVRRVSMSGGTATRTVAPSSVPLIGAPSVEHASPVTAPRDRSASPSRGSIFPAQAASTAGR